MIEYPDNTRDISYDGLITSYPVYNKVIPTENDYESGFITRYFVKKANDKIVYEVASDNYTDISTNIYIKIAINWKLTGKRNDVFKDKIKIEEGVYEYNRNQINIHKKYIPEIESTLKNPLEYWKPS